MVKVKAIHFLKLFLNFEYLKLPGNYAMASCGEELRVSWASNYSCLIIICESGHANSNSPCRVCENSNYGLLFTVALLTGK